MGCLVGFPGAFMLCFAIVVLPNAPFSETKRSPNFLTSLISPLFSDSVISAKSKLNFDSLDSRIYILLPIHQAKISLRYKLTQLKTFVHLH